MPSSAECQPETAPFQGGSLRGPNTGDISTQFTPSYKGTKVQPPSLGAHRLGGEFSAFTIGLEALPQTQLVLSGS